LSIQASPKWLVKVLRKFFGQFFFCEGKEDSYNIKKKNSNQGVCKAKFGYAFTLKAKNITSKAKKATNMKCNKKIQTRA